MKRLYRATATHADEPEMNIDISGDIETITAALPNALIDILKGTAEVNDDQVRIEFMNGLVLYTVNTEN